MHWFYNRTLSFILTILSIFFQSTMSIYQIQHIRNFHLLIRISVQMSTVSIPMAQQNSHTIQLYLMEEFKKNKNLKAMLQSISPRSNGTSTPCKSIVEGEVVGSRPTKGACATYELKKGNITIQYCNSKFTYKKAGID